MCANEPGARKKSAGFTIIELIMVVAIGLLLVGVGVPGSVSFYRSVIADDAIDEVAGALRQASRNAALGKNDSAHGIRIDRSSVTVFQGDAYESRQQSFDIAIAIPEQTVISEMPNEIVFARGTGAPTATGTLRVTLYERTGSIGISESGVISQLP